MSLFDDIACRMRPVAEQAADPCRDFLGMDPQTLQAQLKSGEVGMQDVWLQGMAGMVSMPEIEWAKILLIVVVGYVAFRVLMRLVLPDPRRY